jgi:hypothetical protein
MDHVDNDQKKKHPQFNIYAQKPKKWLATTN